MVAEIIRGPKFFGCSPIPDQSPILVLKVVLAGYFPKPSYAPNSKLLASMVA